jgi:hypothetical protein
MFNQRIGRGTEEPVLTAHSRSMLRGYSPSFVPLNQIFGPRSSSDTIDQHTNWEIDAGASDSGALLSPPM